MTILFLARLFYPHIGGVEKHVLEVSKRLVQLGHRVIVVTENHKPPLTHLVNRIEGIEIIRINAGKDDMFKKFRIWKSLWQLRTIIKEADIIHCHDVFFWYLPFRFLYPRKPVYTTFHGYESYPVSMKAIIIRKISEKLSWGNICIGDFIKKWYGTKSDYVSYGAVDSVIARRHDQAILKNDKKYSALFIGRLDEQTGILTYVKALEILKIKYPNFELLVVGDGEYKRLIERQVKVLGFQKNPEKYLRQSHFAFVSRYLSILEAIAAKRLVFAVYDNPIKEDYLKMTPFAKFIIIENDPERLAEKVKYFLTHPEKEKDLVNDAYDWVKKQSWDTLVKLYLSLWNKPL